MKIKYIGKFPINFKCPGYFGKVAPEQELDLEDSAIDELKGRKDWKLVGTSKPKAKAKKSN